MKQQFNPTPEMVSAANALFMAKAYTQTIRPTIEAIQKKHLDILRPKHRHEPEKEITDIKYSWCMNDDDFKIYIDSCREDYVKAGFKIKDDECPLLIAEHLEIQAEQCLVDAMKPITKLDWNDFFSTTQWKENLNKYLDLTLSLLAPYCKNKLFKTT